MTGNQPKRNPAAHLRKFQWKPGQSGNPSGKPVGTLSLVAMIRKLLNEDPDAARLIAENLVRQAATHDEKALGFIRTILDRVDGPVPTQIQGPQGEPLAINLQWAGAKEPTPTADPGDEGEEAEE